MLTSNTYLYVILYVFVFLAILFGIQLLSIRSEEYLADDESKKKKRYQSENKITDVTDVEPTITTDVTDVEPTTDLFISEVNESDLSINEIIKVTKGRSKGEKLCRYYLEQIYHKPFPSKFPKMLTNPKTGHPLEFDGYNEELNIAFEYNGGQHYDRVPLWQPTDSDFMYQLEKDKYKRKVCEKQGVYLIKIPYTIPLNEIKDCIIFYLPENVHHRRELRKMGYDVPEEYEPEKLRK